MVTSDEFIEKFISFFKGKGHKIIPSSSLIPENDSTALFTVAGMQPLSPYLMGEPHPLGKRLCGVQKCIRTNDIDEVGDGTHLTFFEMLGNWSLGDYFKEEAINWSLQFLTEELKLPKEKLAISVFKGNKKIKADSKSARIWRKIGINEERIAYLGEKDNWWGPVGETGPCGPDTEMFYWTGKDNPPKKFNPSNEKWVEIWNNVFMEYEKKENGEFSPLKQKNVDTGMGMERVLAILNRKENIFQTEIFLPIIKRIKEFSSKFDERRARIIADHIKASVFLISAGVNPSNVQRGYVLRKLIRRAKREGTFLGINKPFLGNLVGEITFIYQKRYPELIEKKDEIIKVINGEEKLFQSILNKGEKLVKKIKRGKNTGKEAFNLYQTYGLPIEVTEEIASRLGFKIDRGKFEEELKRHQQLSKTAAKGMFKSGLADNSPMVTKYHTATHLLHQALRQILGEEVRQMGSNITSERLRFDFSFPRKLTEEEKKKVEDLVNQKIKENLSVKREEMPLRKALESGALAFFREKYPEIVSVYIIADKKSGKIFSKEICSGPHVESTGELGKFVIIKEESSSKGVRRIKAVLKQ